MSRDPKFDLDNARTKLRQAVDQAHQDIDLLAEGLIHVPHVLPALRDVHLAQQHVAKCRADYLNSIPY